MIAHLHGRLLENDGDTIVPGRRHRQVWISGATRVLPVLEGELRLRAFALRQGRAAAPLYGFAA
jgi:hypothetical protein